MDAIFGNNKPPPPPDYAGAAEATAAGDIAAARYQTVANRPDSYYPGGSRTWEQGYTDPVIDQAGYDQAMADWNLANPEAAPGAAPGASPSQFTQTDPGGFTTSAAPGTFTQTDPGGFTSSDTGYEGDDRLGGIPTPKMDYTTQAPQGQDSGARPDIADYTTPGSPDQWTETVSLSPEGQKAFDIGERNTTAAAQLGSQALGQASDIMSTPFTIEGDAPTYQGATGDMPTYQGAAGSAPQFQGPEGQLGNYGQHRQGVVDAMMSRVNTDVGRDREAKRSELVAQGIPVGSEAFNRQMQQLDRKQTDARQRAEIAAEQMAGMGYASDIAGRRQMGSEGMDRFNTGMQGRQQFNKEAMDRFGTGMDVRNQYNQEGMTNYNTGMQGRNQGIQEALMQRQMPINEWGAMMSGSQVATPQFQNFGQQGQTGGPNYSTAAAQTGQYNLGANNAGIARDNSLMGGLFDVGASIGGAYPWSDRRLKKNLKRLGTSLMGLPVYAFDYIWGGDRQVGVMAQDVIKVVPEAVHTNSEGYMAVDYGMIS